MEVLGDKSVRFQNRCQVDPPLSPDNVIGWRSSKPALGALTGVFAVTGETILSFFQTAGQKQSGSETLILLTPDRYRASGILMSSGVVATIGSMELVRQD